MSRRRPSSSALLYLARGHLNDHATDRPYVYSAPVSFRIRFGEHFRRHVRLRAHQADQFALHCGVRLNLHSRSKVTQFQTICAIRQKNVGRLDIAMHDTVLVQLRHRLQQLRTLE